MTNSKSCGKAYISSHKKCHVGSGELKVNNSAPNSTSKLSQLGRTKIPLQNIVLATVAGAIASGVIANTARSTENYRVFALDRKFWKKNGVPTELQKAYPSDNGSGLNASLLAAEQRIQGKNYETLYILDKNGKPVKIKSGGDNSVALNIFESYDVIKKTIGKSKDKDFTITHNHPAGGATFSPADIRFAATHGIQNVRATTPNEIYIFSQKSFPDGTSFKKRRSKGLKLASDYNKIISPILNKGSGKTLHKVRKSISNPGDLLYLAYTREGTREINTKFGRDIEAQLHQELKKLIEENYSDYYSYERIPRLTTQKREKKFNSDAYKIGYSLDSGIKKIECQPENTLCGQRCLPKGQKCSKNKVSAIALTTSLTAGALALSAYAATRKTSNALALSQAYQKAIRSTGIAQVYTATASGISKLINNSKNNPDYENAIANTLLVNSQDKDRVNYVGRVISNPHLHEHYQSAVRYTKKNNTDASPEELAALRYYTDSRGYKEMNMILRNQKTQLTEYLESTFKDNRDASQVEQDARMDIKMASRALKHMPKFKGNVYRGLNLDPQIIATKLQPGQVWHETGFTSTTKNLSTAYSGNCVFVINSSSGRDITKIEKYKNDEVLYPSNSSFVVNKIKKVNKIGQEFYLVNLSESIKD